MIKPNSNENRTDFITRGLKDEEVIEAFPDLNKRTKYLKNIYDIAFENRPMPGPKGEKGDKGEPGEKGEKGEKGEPGEKPLKGKDYLTPDEMILIQKNIENKIIIPEPKHIIEKKALTSEERQSLISEVLGKIDFNLPLPSSEQIRDLLLKLKGDDRLDAKAIKNLPTAKSFAVGGISNGNFLLTGLSLATSTVISAIDTAIIAFGKLQAQITANLSTLTSHIGNTSNPHSVTKSQVGLGSVANADTTTTANITDSTNKRFITDLERTVLSNTSGTNTGNETASTIFARLGRPSKIVGQYYPSEYYPSSGAAGALSSSVLYYIPYPVQAHESAASIYLRVTTNIANAKVRSWVVASDANGKPTGSPLTGTDTGDIQLDGTTNAQDAEFTYSSPVTFSSVDALIYVAVEVSANISTNLYAAAAYPSLGLTNADKSTTRPYNHFRTTSWTYGTASAVSTVVGSVNTAPFIMFKKN